MKMSKKTVITAAVFSAAMNLSACAYGPPYDPADNRNGDVYGPPILEQEYEEDTSDNTDVENDNMEEAPEND